MKIKHIIILFVFLFASSSWGESRINHNIKAQNSNIATYEIINKLNINLKNVKNRKQFLKNWFLKKYLKTDNTISITELRNVKLSISVYNLSLTNDFPSSLNKKYSIVYFEKSNISFLIPIEYNQIFQIGKELMIGGYKESREYEFYHIYVIKQTTLKLVMDTSKDCNSGIKIGYYRNDECLEYMPNRFGCKVYKSNEIRFVGKIKNYCKPKIDRDQNNLKPLEILNSKIIYKYCNGKWIFQKESTYKCW